jgi:hypothetical protein
MPPAKRQRSEADGMPDVSELRAFMKQEETALRESAGDMLNKDLVERIQASKALVARVQAQPTFAAACEEGAVAAVRAELGTSFRLGVRLETWLNTYQPPLSSGGNAGVSMEVQDGIYQYVHAMTNGSTEALHRMHAFEKEHAAMRTKTTGDGKDPQVWERYLTVLEENQMHDINRSVLQMQSELMLIGNSLLNNLKHLRSAAEDSVGVASMY